MVSPWDYRWDFAVVFPIIQEYLIREQFPHIVSTTAIHDRIENHPEIQKYRILTLKQCINHSLRELGYRKASVVGKRYEKTNIGIIVPLPRITI